ncbi:MAG TPA: T9SS type A sorting domain-containing protein [Bacteroidia bacterium]|jgi:hypothetical protein|nr:T9SS type A sorting domain-containing protein [Bacteroidia bacterium]
MKKTLLYLFAFLFISLKYNAQISTTFTNIVQPCNNNGTATIIATGGTQPYTYNWQEYYVFNGAVYSVTGSTTNSISNASPGTYFVTVTDANNLSVTDTINLTGVVYFLHDTITSIFPYKGIGAYANCPSYTTNLTASIGGTNAPYTFSLLTNTQTTTLTSCTFNNLPVGYYTCTVVDNLGCTDTVPVAINAYAGYFVNTTSTPDTCTTNGTATAVPTGGGTAPFTYLWNTTPPQTTKTAVGLASYNNSGTFIQVTVTDANGCVSTGYPYVQDSITAHSIQSVATIHNATCGQSNGFVKVSNTGGNPPYTYLWSTGSTVDSIYNLPSGTYTLVVSDAAGCHEKFIKPVQNISPVYIYLSSTNTDCVNMGGIITTTVGGGTPPYTYHWSNGQTTPNLSNLGAGLYQVSVTDVNGCQSWAYDSVYNPLNCVAKISGRVINDMNGNCALDINESGLPQQIIQLNNGALYSSDWTGKYYIPPVLNPTGTYTILQSPKVPWAQICPAVSITLNPIGGSNYPNNDFYNKPIPLYNDLHTYTYTDSCRPGFVFNQWISVFNNGTSTMTGTANLQHDALLNVIGTGGASSYNASTHTFTFSFNNLAPMTWVSFVVQLQAPSNAALFTPLITYAVANPISGDATPANNYDTLFYRVTGSYDPNEKSVNPQGTGTQGFISPTDSVLNYTIHFQNTGSYPTNMVSIIDTIDNNLDIYSLKVTGSFTGGNNNYLPKISFLSNNVIKFTFNYCHLQPAALDLVNSSGFIGYTINQKKNLSNGTQIKNRANIYFDFNTAILTNTTLNTISTPLGISTFNTQNSIIKTYPNPAQNKITIDAVDIIDVKLFDVLGKQITSTKTNEVDVNNLNDGIYFVQIKTSTATTTQKIIVQR